MCPGSIKKPSRCNGFDKHCQESVLESFRVSILKGLVFGSCKGHCKCSDLSYTYLHVCVLQLPQLSCANFMEFLLQFCLMIEVMVAAKNTLVLVWCSAGCHRSVTFACPLAQEGVHPRLRF